MKFIKSLLMVLALSSAMVAQAQEDDVPSEVGDIGGLEDILGGGSMEDMIFNAAYMYASKDPRYSAALSALGIRSGADLKKFLMGEGDGSNAETIVNHLSFEFAKDNNAFKNWFKAVGVKDVPTLKAFRKGKGAKYKSTLNKMALAQARADVNYQDWLEENDIGGIGDLDGILNGDGGGNILQTVWPFAKALIEERYPEYAQYIPIIESLLGLSSDDGTDDGTDDGEVSDDDGEVSDDDGENPDNPTEEEDNNNDSEDNEDPTDDEFEEIDPPELDGIFDGLEAREIRVIQKAKVLRAPKNGTLLD